MAEELMRLACPDLEVESAGIKPSGLNPLAVEVLKEIGINIEGKATQDVFDVYRSGRLFSTVITVCDEASAERCPIFPGVVNRLHWGFPDPSEFQGTWEEKLEMTRRLRMQIKKKIGEWCEANCAVTAS